MIAKPLFLLAFLGAAFVCRPAWPANVEQVYNCVRYAQNGNDVIADADCVAAGLRNGADPNWVNPETKESTLSNFVDFFLGSSGPNITAAIKALITAGAKLQPEDSGILFFPIVRGQEQVVRMLLDLGANPSSWPKGIGTALSPVETAATHGYSAIVDLLVKHGATRPSSNVSAQLRFIEASGDGSISELAALLKQGAKINKKNPDNEWA